MKVPVMWIRAAAFAIADGAGIYLFALWQPARQVELHTANLLKRAADRDWPAVQAMLAADYRDAWGHDCTAVIDEARRLFSHFFALHIVSTEDPQIAWDSGEVVVSVRLGIYGTGTAIAEAMMEEVREARGPFEFHWRKSGRWPWQWALVQAEHEQLARKYAR